MMPYTAKPSIITAKNLAEGRPISLTSKRSAFFYDHAKMLYLLENKRKKNEPTSLRKVMTPKVRPVSPPTLTQGFFKELKQKPESLEDIMNDLKNMKANHLLLDAKLKGKTSFMNLHRKHGV